MNFSKVSTSDAAYQIKFGDINIQNFKVYTEPNHCMGRVVEVLRDEHQNDYLVVETGSWLAKRELVVPISQFNLVPTQSRIYLGNLVLEQNGDRRSYRLASRPATYQEINSLYDHDIDVAQLPVEVSAPLEASAPLSADILRKDQHDISSSSHGDRSVAAPEDIRSQPWPTGMPVGAVSDAGQESIRLLEERLVIDRHRRKVGEVVVRKEIETQIIEVPIHREKLVVEQLSPERKQLASIQLGQHVGLHPTGFSLSDLNQQPERRFSISHAAQSEISLATAKRLIDRLLQSARFNQARVQIVFEDQELQTQYDQWLLEQDSTGSTVR